MQKKEQARAKRREREERKSSSRIIGRRRRGDRAWTWDCRPTLTSRVVAAGDRYAQASAEHVSQERRPLVSIATQGASEEQHLAAAACSRLTMRVRERSGHESRCLLQCKRHLHGRQQHGRVQERAALRRRVRACGGWASERADADSERGRAAVQQSATERQTHTQSAAEASPRTTAHPTLHSATSRASPRRTALRSH